MELKNLFKKKTNNSKALDDLLEIQRTFDYDMGGFSRKFWENPIQYDSSTAEGFTENMSNLYQSMTSKETTPELLYGTTDKIIEDYRKGRIKRLAGEDNIFSIMICYEKLAGMLKDRFHADAPAMFGALDYDELNLWFADHCRDWEENKGILAEKTDYIYAILSSHAYMVAEVAGLEMDGIGPMDDRELSYAPYKIAKKCFPNSERDALLESSHSMEEYYAGLKKVYQKISDDYYYLPYDKEAGRLAGWGKECIVDYMTMREWEEMKKNLAGPRFLCYWCWIRTRMSLKDLDDVLNILKRVKLPQEKKNQIDDYILHHSISYLHAPIKVVDPSEL